MSEMSLSMRAPSVVPRYAVVVGSLKQSAEGERRYGRDALSNPSGGRVVAKANEADCTAQTPKWTYRRGPERGGASILRY